MLTLPASELVRLVAAGEMSAADLLRAHLARVDRISHLNAFVDVRAQAGLAEAVAQDEAAARDVPRGVLGGLPVTLKSAVEVNGLRCETGSPSRRGRLATRDAVVVSRRRQAGAIVLGTTNVAEMLMGTRNLAKTPGGPSGGEALAVATGASSGESEATAGDRFACRRTSPGSAA